MRPGRPPSRRPLNATNQRPKTPSKPAGKERRMSEQVQTTYDEVPYDSLAFPQTHPGTMATVASLFGMTPAPVTNCRVLELGCAAGFNLIPMAASLPDSRFVGVDLSPRQVLDGQEA